MGATVLLTGVGHLGGPILERLAASGHIERVVAVARDARRGRERCNLARLSAVAGGSVCRVEFRAVDLRRIDQMAELVHELSPRVVVHTASRQTWWLPDLFADAQRAQLRRPGYGAWLPLHLTLAVSLMRALEQADYSGTVLNAVYPDVVNVVLARTVRAPDAGLGNISELVAKLRLDVGETLGVPPQEPQVWLVAHHAMQRFAFAADDGRAAAARDDGGAGAASSNVPPFHVRVEHRGEDVTEAVRAHHLLTRACPLPGGPAWGTFSAAASVRLIEAVLDAEPSHAHASGPAGLPGGYPVRVGDGSIEVRHIPDLDLAGAVDINERSHRFDGIETIGEDGTVVFTEGATSAMQELLGYHCRKLAPAHAAAQADELAARFGEYAARHGIDLSVARR